MIRQRLNVSPSLSQTINDIPHLEQKLNISGSGGGVDKQVYIGSDYPTSDKILIWIDTSEPTPPPITGIQLLTADNLQFKTSDNKAFILSEITPNVLLTKDNKEFIEANNKKFILREEN